MIIELHAIQSFAPANLNRDDMGAPKECTFGGVRRARVSSQSWKRAVRVAFREDANTIELGVRTKRAHGAIVKRVTAADADIDPEEARHRAAVLLEADPLGLTLKLLQGEDEDAGEVKTGQLVFLRESDLDDLASLAVQYGDALDDLPSSLELAEGKKASKKPVLPKELAKVVSRALTSPGAALDVALFGRMLAELPEANVDAACQVAHAVGTHRLSAENDYYTAVDDLRPEDTEGADMIGDIQFNASCLYRYAAIDVDQLGVNLGTSAGDEHVEAALSSFGRAFITTAPTGKQTTFAARNLPTAVLAVRRRAGAANLINGFVAPVRETDGTDGIPVLSVLRMLKEFETLERLYGARDGSTSAVLLSAIEAGDGPWSTVEHLDDLVAHVSHA